MRAVAQSGERRPAVSIRLRLTLLYTAILALTLIAFGSMLYLAQSRATYDGVRANLERQALDYARREAMTSPPDGGNGQLPGAPPEMSLPNGTLPGRWTQTRSMDGTVLGKTPDLGTESLPLSDEGLQQAQGGQGVFEPGVVESQPVLVYSRPYTTREGAAQIVQIAFPTSQPQQSLNALRFILILGSGLAIVAAFALGWVLAGTALDPIHKITQTAREIGREKDFGRRVAYEGAEDEVGRLAHTFNEMLTQLESSYRQLETLLDSQRRFVADASHELRTPLTTVRGNMELLRREPQVPAAERAEILADTTDEVDRLIRLVSQLLALARADAGQQLELEDVPLRPLIEDACRQARALAPGSEIRCAGELAGNVEGNRDAIRQVLLILLDNAVRHAGAGTPVEIGTEPTGDRVGIYVADRGQGIPPAILHHVFERFYRGEASRSGEGAGLGLAIAKELVELQGGTIRAESREGAGARFTVELPAGQTDGARALARQPAAANATTVKA